MFWFRAFLGIGLLIFGTIGATIELIQGIDIESDPAIYIVGGILMFHIAMTED